MGAKAKAKRRGEPSIKGRAMPPPAWEAGGKDNRADGNGERKLRAFPSIGTVSMRWEGREIHRGMIKTGHLKWPHTVTGS